MFKKHILGYVLWSNLHKLIYVMYPDLKDLGRHWIISIQANQLANELVESLYFLFMMKVFFNLWDYVFSYVLKNIKMITSYL